MRRHRTVKDDGTVYTYLELLASVRTARGPRQRLVCSLGKLPDLDDREALGWEELARVLSGRPRPPADLFAPAPPPPPDWATVDLQRVRVERLRRFGDGYLGLALWRRLGLHERLADLLPRGQEAVGWDTLACLLVLARFCEPSSELAIAERWFDQTALDELLGLPPALVNDDRLYRALDALLPHKDALCQHLVQRYATWFGTQVEFLLYDVTSTYFEGQARQNQKAAHGYSRDHRPDCKQVCLGLVVTPEGLPVGYEVFRGDRADVTTVDDIVRLMTEKYGQARRIWVFDRGMVSEENLAKLRAQGARYVVGTHKQMMRHYADALRTAGWTAAVAGVEVKTVPAPDGVAATEHFVLCRSPQRREKEKAILTKQAARLEAKLQALQTRVRAGRLKDRTAIERLIGRYLGHYTRAEALFAVTVLPATGPATDLQITKRQTVAAWADLAQGAYLLRSNVAGQTPLQLWHWYMQLTQAEAAFRTTKSDLGLRPVYHQKTDRVEAHLLVCFLALVLWRSLERWLDQQGLGSCARQLLLDLREVQSQDVLLTVQDRGVVRLRCVGRPERHVRQVLARLGLPLPTRPKRIETTPQCSGTSL